MMIFIACNALGYVPLSWRAVTIIFIPTPEHTTYVQANSFHPVSLTSFLLKTLKRLVGRYIPDGALVRYPLRLQEYAYKADRSIQTALHSLVRLTGSLRMVLLLWELAWTLRVHLIWPPLSPCVQHMNIEWSIM
jgi:hypothetical protein